MKTAIRLKVTDNLFGCLLGNVSYARHFVQETTANYTSLEK